MEKVYIIDNYETGEYEVYKTQDAAMREMMKIYVDSMRKYIERTYDEYGKSYEEYDPVTLIKGMLDDLEGFAKYNYFEDVCSVAVAELKG